MTALWDKQAALAARRCAVASADRILIETLGGAQAAATEARRRIDAMAAEIDACVANPAGAGIDTALGARELQQWLIAKYRDLATVVAAAQQDDAARQRLLESLRAQYAPAPHAP